MLFFCTHKCKIITLQNLPSYIYLERKALAAKCHKRKLNLRETVKDLSKPECANKLNCLSVGKRRRQAEISLSRSDDTSKVSSQDINKVD